MDVGPCGTFFALLQALGFNEAGFSLVLPLACGASLILRVDMQWRSRSCFGCGVQQSLLRVSVDVLGALADVCRGKSEQLSNDDMRWAPSVVSTLGI